MKVIPLLVSLVLFARALTAAPVTVQAASSLTDAMKEIAAAYEKESGTTVRLNFDASSILARQIEEGAPAGVFLSADVAKMDALEKEGLLLPGTRRPLLRNTLVVVVPSESVLLIHSANDLAAAAIGKIAVAQPETVPAGIYARQYLTSRGLWEKLRGRIIPTQNVRAALAAVESGNVEAGFVYKTDALISRKVKVAWEVPRAEGPQIVYPVAALRGAEDAAAAKQFLAYLEGEAARKIFQRYGFSFAE